MSTYYIFIDMESILNWILQISKIQNRQKHPALFIPYFHWLNHWHDQLISYKISWKKISMASKLFFIVIFPLAIQELYTYHIDSKPLIILLHAIFSLILSHFLNTKAVFLYFTQNSLGSNLETYFVEPEIQAIKQELKAELGNISAVINARNAAVGLYSAYDMLLPEKIPNSKWCII